mmetsp:Transcript_11591/g.19198  ORF Transcript_11591/g.19198 Transcript_11591/m.19198 type:complete len:148 (+) Transcript_11591:2184-2627(+)
MVRGMEIYLIRLFSAIELIDCLSAQRLIAISLYLRPKQLSILLYTWDTAVLLVVIFLSYVCCQPVFYPSFSLTLFLMVVFWMPAVFDLAGDLSHQEAHVRIPSLHYEGPGYHQQDYTIEKKYHRLFRHLSALQTKSLEQHLLHGCVK